MQTEKQENHIDNSLEFLFKMSIGKPINLANFMDAHMPISEEYAKPPKVRYDNKTAYSLPRGYGNNSIQTYGRQTQGNLNYRARKDTLYNIREQYKVAA